MVKGIAKKDQAPFDENPTNWKFLDLKILMPDGNWLLDSKENDTYEVRRLNKQWQEKHSYIYFTRSGKVQSVTATIWVEERRWLHIPTSKIKIARDIEIDFSDELGSEAGSWKGGTTGCCYEMLENETPLETLRRMEKTRSFY